MVNMTRERLAYAPEVIKASHYGTRIYSLTRQHH